MGADVVSAIPSMGSVYARAVKTLNRKSKNPVLPEVTLVFQGAQANRDKLGEFRRAVKAPANGKLPSLYVHSLAFPLAMSLMLRDDFPLPLLGMIHLTNQVEVAEPLGETELFDVEVNAENLVAHSKGVCCDLLVKIVVDGQTRMLLRSTFLAKGVKIDGQTLPALAHSRFTAPQRTAQWKLAAGAGRDWAAVAGDYNPIHLSALSAKALGMPRAIAHGIYLAARALAGIEPASGNYSWRIEFKTPVFLPGIVDLGYEATGSGYKVQGWNPRKLKPHFELDLSREN
ncbi:MaoC family dehydratase [Glutamicibacter sp.]|uniref:MaoC family dehydratase n=1 Tax=Glutamicibacter sp. TaxID=1931995 RepID=UPI002B47FC67|nr:MaoC family dehydratase [Glutamicibacter sp.]HJX77215.1 MaoC family dehydratase [Glutamicibacter sp.]